jgi:hypothetical protein
MTTADRHQQLANQANLVAYLTADYMGSFMRRPNLDPAVADYAALARRARSAAQAVALEIEALGNETRQAAAHAGSDH